jgi:hypothetical protein
MASSINASVSGAGGIITTADNTGILQLQAAGTTIATVSSTGLALNTGNITLPSGAAPAFSAYQSSAQSLANNTFTKIQFQTKTFDTNSNYDNTTNYRFTPTVAGYYYVTEEVALNSLTANSFSSINKNGNAIAYSPVSAGWSGIANTLSSIATIVYMNGSTDYLEVWAYQATGGSLNSVAASNATIFSAFLARSA